MKFLIFVTELGIIVDFLFTKGSRAEWERNANGSDPTRSLTRNGAIDDAASKKTRVTLSLVYLTTGGRSGIQLLYNVCRIIESNLSVVIKVIE